VTVPAATLTAAQRVVLALLSGYKVLLSQLFAGSCRYVPSCSQYAREAVVEHGVIRGSWLAARRLARCHPGAAYGLDPVPPRAPSLER
jgi:putative membrane protein insertion efficiency factor